MALYTKPGNQIPKDAVLLSAEDALAFQRNIIFSWQAKSEVFFAKYGGGILAAAASLSGMYFNNYFRYKLRLQSFARFMTYVPAVVIPAIVSYSLHEKGVMDKIYIEQYPCPVCVELRAMTIQVLSGVFYPMSLAPLATFMMATRYHTYNMPILSKDPRGTFNLFKKLTYPIRINILGITILQLLLTAFVTYKEEKNVATVKRKLMEMEEELDNARPPGTGRSVPKGPNGLKYTKGSGGSGI